MTNEGRWYVLGGVVIIGLVLYVWLGSLLWWIVGGVVALYAIYQGVRLWSKADAGLTQAKLRRLNVKKAKAEVSQAEAQAATFWEQSRMIPATMAGILLKSPEEKALVHVWPQPSSITYTGLEPPAVVEADPLPLPAVSFRDIAHQIGAGQMLIGVRPDGSLRLGTWEDHKTILVLGKSSSGKSTTIAQKAGEAVKSGACLVVCDPHEAKPDSLARKLEPLRPFLLPGTGIASRHEDILAQIQRVAAILQLRVRRAPPEPPIVLIVEELNRLMRDDRLAEDIARITQEIGQEGRGFGIYAVFGAQDMVGPAFAKMRRSFISYIVHRTDQAQAGLLIPARYAKTAPELAAGQTYVVDADGVTEPLRQPLITSDDLEELARRVPRRAPAAWPSGLSSILKPGQNEAEVLQGARAAREEAEQEAVSPVSLAPEDTFSAPNITFFSPREREKREKGSEHARILELHRQGYKPYVIARQLGRAGAYAETVKQIIAEAEVQEAEGTREDEE